MTDNDQINIYTYKGRSYMTDFTEYLQEHDITIAGLELMNGMIGIWPSGSQKPVMVPQYARWGDVVGKLAKHA